MSDGHFVTDQGLTFNIVENLHTGQTESLERALISCDILKMGNSKTEYDIRLRNAANILDKAPLRKETAPTEVYTVQDPTNILDLWFSGGYMNIGIQYFAESGKGIRHEVNLVYEGMSSEGHDFRFIHNAHGDVKLDNGAYYWLANTYVSFPITDILPEEEDNDGIRPKVNIRYISYKVGSASEVPESEERTITIDYIVPKFIHEKLLR